MIGLWLACGCLVIEAALTHRFSQSLSLLTAAQIGRPQGESLGIGCPTRSAPIYGMSSLRDALN